MNELMPSTSTPINGVACLGDFFPVGAAFAAPNQGLGYIRVSEW